jgi:hypothetical protein
MGNAIFHRGKKYPSGGSGGGSGGGGSSVNYSTTEQVIGTWIDGKPLYQICKSYTVNRSTRHDFNFTDGNAKVVNGYIINSLKNISFPLNATWDSLTENFLLDETHFYVKTTNNIGDNSTLFLVVQYTKTTD